MNNMENGRGAETERLLGEEDNSGPISKADFFCADVVTTIVGIVMTVIGYNYNWQYHKGEEGVSTEEDNLCPNGAALWLWIFGIYALVGVLLDLFMKTCVDESVVMKVQPIVIWAQNISWIAMFIWGTVVVFGAYDNWTDDFETYKANNKKMNFCEHKPMMTAFVILILLWVLLGPFAFCVTFCCFGHKIKALAESAARRGY